MRAPGYVSFRITFAQSNDFVPKELAESVYGGDQYEYHDNRGGRLSELKSDDGEIKLPADAAGPDQL